MDTNTNRRKFLAIVILQHRLPARRRRRSRVHKINQARTQLREYHRLVHELHSARYNKLTCKNCY
uniref:Uncharacterized protein n=1 Tax=Anguilla anguilla TaxID=7936 RepID=A0A0E9SIC6_ANGAN